jgi:hypothetical protein
MIAGAPTGQIGARMLGALLQKRAQGADILGRIEPPPAGTGFRRRAAAVKMQLPQIGVGHTQKLSHLSAGELAQGAPGIWREKLLTMRLQPFRQPPGMVAHQSIDPLLPAHRATAPPSRAPGLHHPVRRWVAFVTPKGVLFVVWR